MLSLRYLHTYDGDKNHIVPDVCTYYEVRATLKYNVIAFQRRVPIVITSLRYLCGSFQSLASKSNTLM